MKNKITIPGIYKHFKGNYYATMFVSESIDVDELINIFKEQEIDPISSIFMNTEHTETGSIIRLFKVYNGITYKIYHIKQECEDNLVIYKSLYDGHMAYARPCKMFISEVDLVKHPDCDQKFRFELFKYEVGGKLND